jgi:hypothetical protein
LPGGGASLGRVGSYAEPPARGAAGGPSVHPIASVSPIAAAPASLLRIMRQ